MSLRSDVGRHPHDLIYLPPDTFTSRMPSTLADRAPRVVSATVAMCGSPATPCSTVACTSRAVTGGRRGAPGRIGLRLRHADASRESERAAA